MKWSLFWAFVQANHPNEFRKISFFSAFLLWLVCIHCEKSLRLRLNYGAFKELGIIIIKKV